MKNIISVVAIGMICIGLPILIVNLRGIAEDSAYLGLNWQELMGVGGFFFIYIPVLFGFNKIIGFMQRVALHLQKRWKQ